MRGDLLLKALAILEIEARSTADFMKRFLSSSKFSYLPLKEWTPNATPILTELLEQKISESNQFHSVFQKLRKEGLIKQDAKKNVWSITEWGKGKLRRLIQQRELRPKKYSVEKTGEVVIVSFDVPEKERAKRNWLRHVLKEMGFTMIQKSVWLANLRLPKEFLDDLRSLKLMDCVQIFSVGRSGTLKSIS